MQTQFPKTGYLIPFLEYTNPVMMQRQKSDNLNGISVRKE